MKIANLFVKFMTLNNLLRLKVNHMMSLLARPDSLTFLPLIQDFLSTHPISNWPEDLKNKFYTTLAAYPYIQKTRKQMIPLLTSTVLPTLSLELSNLAYQLKWISQSQRQDNFKRLLIEILNNPGMNIETKDWICSQRDLLEVKYSRKDFRSIQFKNTHFIEALGCLLSKDSDPQILLAFAQSLNHPNKSLRRTAALALERLKPQDPEIHLALAKSLNDCDEFVRTNAAEALREIKPQNPEVHLALVKSLNDPISTVRNSAVQALKMIKPRDKVILQKLEELSHGSNSSAAQLAESVLDAIKENQ